MVRKTILLLFLLNLCGCDLFRTRDPQSPNQGTSNFQPPVTPEIVLDNFKSSIVEYNIDNYIRCFVDSSVATKTYNFQPSADFQGIFQNWGIDDERRYFQNLGKPTTTPPYLNFLNLKQDNRTSTSTEFSMEYDLLYPHHKTNVTKEVRGYMRLYLVIDSRQLWSIYKWVDEKTTTDSTWSYLKYYFY
jgi:hypothetical protein